MDHKETLLKIIDLCNKSLESLGARSAELHANADVERARVETENDALLDAQAAEQDRHAKDYDGRRADRVANRDGLLVPQDHDTDVAPDSNARPKKRTK